MTPKFDHTGDGRLQASIDAGRKLGKLALYFGAIGGPGHYLHQPDGSKTYPDRLNSDGFPWTAALIDCGLPTTRPRWGTHATTQHDGYLRVILYR